MEKELTRYALKTGYLEKVGHIRKTWKKRLFVLTSSELSYIDGESVKGKIPLENIADLVKTEDEGKPYCLFIKTTEEFNKDYTVSCDTEAIRKEWIEAIIAAKENKPMPDSINKAFVMKNEEDIVDDSKAYFNRMLTAFGETFRDESSQDVILRLSSFFNRVAFLDILTPDEIISSGEQVVRMSQHISQEMQRNSLMTQDIEHLLNDLDGCIKYAKAKALIKQERLQMASSERTPETQEESYSHHSITLEDHQESRGVAKHGFSNHYEIKETLGSGAYSVVYASVNRQNGKRYAVKCIKKKDLSKGDIESLKNEVLIMGSLNHKNIVRLEEFYDEKDYYYIVTEIVEGGELFEKIVEKKFYNENEARAVVKTLVETVGYCHKLNIAHRDLKPENILVDDKSGEIKIADFGFAKSTTSTETGRLETDCGSPWYVAPEILKGHMYGTEVDMWSLGVIIYILLCGYPPFHDSNQPRLFKKIRSGQFRFDSPYWDNVSEQAKDLIRHLLVVDPTHRYDCKQVLAHEWFHCDVSNADNKALGSVIHELRTFNNQRKGIIKQGYLTKQGHFIRNWRKRSFVLMRDELRYYKSETEIKPQGKITMDEIVELENDPNDELGFVIKTVKGKDYNINATSKKEKDDWIIQINAVKRCYLMRHRAEMHLKKKNYKAALELIWEARNDPNMMNDPNLLQLWGEIAECCQSDCGAMYMIETVEDSMPQNINVIMCSGSSEDMVLVAGDLEGNVRMYSGCDNDVTNLPKFHNNMISAISTMNKRNTPQYVATGAVEGSIMLYDLVNNKAEIKTKEFKRAVSAIDVFCCEGGAKKMIACDREGKVVIWDITKKMKIAEHETDCGNIRGVFYKSDGNSFIMVCESGAVMTYDESFNQLDYFNINTNAMYARLQKDNHLMIADENKQINTYDLNNHSIIHSIQVESADHIHCFDVCFDEKYCVVITNELQFWNLSTKHMEANLALPLTVRAVAMTGEYCSFYMSQDNHLEKWVIDWKITHEGKKYYPPLAQVICNKLK